MSDFVYDSTTLPTGKSDARALTGPAAQSITAAEWNSVMAAISDLRDAVTAGDYHGIVNSASAIGGATGARIRAVAGRLQASEAAGDYRGMVHPEVNIMDFGADPTGVAASDQAIRDAIASFSAEDSSLAGTVIIPPGIWRFSNLVRVKKGVHIKGSHSAFASGGCRIKLDPGVSGFVFERYNTPQGTSDSGAGDGAMLSNLGFYNGSHKVAIWVQSTAYTVGQVRKVGPAPGQAAVLLGSNQYSHYRCTTAGTSAGSGTGPRSLGADITLGYDGQTNNFVIGGYIYGQTSGASGIVINDTAGGSSGTIRLTSVSGTFQNNENLRDEPGTTTYAQADGSPAAAATDELDGTVRWEYIGSGSPIKIRANGVTIANVSMESVSGCGIQIVAQDPEVPNAVANANGWLLLNVNIATCDGHGLYVNGSDANGGNWIGGQVGSCGGPASDEEYSGPGFNIYDSSFLGNTYTGIQFYTVGGQGAIFCDSVGGGSTWNGCYVEGTGGGHSIMLGGNTVVGGGLAYLDLRSTGAPTFNRSAATQIAANSAGTGFGQKVRGWGANSWRPNVYIPVGIQRVNDTNKVYTCITAGTTAGSGGPTGTAGDITDGTVHWAFTHVTDPSDGLIQIGGVDPTYKQFLYMQAPDDVNVALGTYYRFDSFAGVTNTQGFCYGTSGPDASNGENGTGIMHAVNKTIHTEWPYKIPAGRAHVEYMWIGGIRHFASASGADPTVGTFNAGDTMHYKGAACVSGGRCGKKCTTPGTAGSYGGVRTATADGSTTVLISGAAMSTLKDQQDFKVGDKLTINSITARVQTVSDNGLTLVMGSAVTAGSGLAITFSNPVWKEYGDID